MDEHTTCSVRTQYHLKFCRILKPLHFRGPGLSPSWPATSKTYREDDQSLFNKNCHCFASHHLVTLSAVKILIVLRPVSLTDENWMLLAADINKAKDQIPIAHAQCVLGPFSWKTTKTLKGAVTFISEMKIMILKHLESKISISCSLLVTPWISCPSCPWWSRRSTSLSGRALTSSCQSSRHHRKRQECGQGEQRGQRHGHHQPMFFLQLRRTPFH